MNISIEQFTELVSQAIDQLPEPTRSKMNNVAILVDDEPTEDQLESVGRKGADGLFGLFEGYCQSRKLNLGPILPDRITLFRKAMIRHSDSQEELINRVKQTINHEIAHHFGSNEEGAKKAEKN